MAGGTVHRNLLEIYKVIRYSNFWRRDIPKARWTAVRIVNENKWIRRFPTNFTITTQVIVEKTAVKPRTEVAHPGLIGDSYVFKMGTMYGIKWKIPEKCPINWQQTKIINGFSVRLRNNSLNFSIRFGGGCVHFTFAFSHCKHEFEFWLWRLIASNSDWTAFSDTQPRSHCSDLRASASRPFDSNQIGVSGI